MDEPEDINITPTDVWAFFLPTRRYRYVDTNQYLALNPDLSESWVRRRLTQLRRAKYLNKPTAQNKLLNRLYRPRVYENTALADEVLAITESNERQLVAFGKNSSHFWHTVAEANFFVSLEIALRAHPHLRLVPWWEVKERKSDLSFTFAVQVDGKTRSYTSDNVYGIVNTTTKNAVFFLLEVDMNTERLTSKNPAKSTIERKYKALDYLMRNQLYRTQLGLGTCMPQFVTTHERHKNGLLKHLGSMQVKHKDAYCFKHLKGIGDLWVAPKPEELLVLDGWERVGFGPYDLSKVA